MKNTIKSIIKKAEKEFNGKFKQNKEFWYIREFEDIFIVMEETEKRLYGRCYKWDIKNLIKIF